ncbi:MAG TPA: UDP-N-acetylglucosamine 2-epimerase [Gemmatimonadales bacterium]|jgi:UDP-hydrolysing UDP-N-acetyl-D-glucosamine 2-epimerase|nr:UDP-N-acetylglucosamine 2-epimerase [Gemmatimonadales bacterium]
MPRTPRRICFVITSFVHYSRNLLVLRELRKRKDVHLSILVGGSALIGKYTSSFGSTLELLTREGFENLHLAHFTLEGDGRAAKSKSTGLGVIECTSAFASIEPDLVMVRGDRFEVLAAVIAAAYMNIPIAHIEAGDTSGTIDESVRHAITKLSQVHFATHADAARRVRAMGENPAYVFDVGSPDAELAAVLRKVRPGAFDINETGSGATLDLGEPYLMVRFHPVWGETPGRMREQTELLLEAVQHSGLQAVWFWPNDDTGAEAISHTLRAFNDQTAEHRIRFMRDLPPAMFISLLAHARCLVGNSSAGVKECSVLGVPVVDVGSRQGARKRAGNVMVVAPKRGALQQAIAQQAQGRRFPRSGIYARTGTARRIARIAATARLYTQKAFHD